MRDHDWDGMDMEEMICGVQSYLYMEAVFISY